MSEHRSAEQQDLAARIQVSLADMHRRFDALDDQQEDVQSALEALRADVRSLAEEIRSLKRELLPARSLGLEDFPSSQSQAESDSPYLPGRET